MLSGFIRRVHCNSVSLTNRDELARRETGKVRTESCVALIGRHKGALSMLKSMHIARDMLAWCDQLDLQLDDTAVGVVIKRLLNHRAPVVPYP